MKTITLEQVEVIPDRVGEFVGAEQKGERYVLRRESPGYVFRKCDVQRYRAEKILTFSYGMTGFYGRRDAAVRDALLLNVPTVPTKCFEFATKEELETWLASE